MYHVMLSFALGAVVDIIGQYVLSKNINTVCMCQVGMYIKSILTSRQYCGEPGTLRFQCQLGGSAALLAPRSHPVSPPQRERHADLSTEIQGT